MAKKKGTTKPSSASKSQTANDASTENWRAFFNEFQKCLEFFKDRCAEVVETLRKGKRVDAKKAKKAFKKALGELEQEPEAIERAGQTLQEEMAEAFGKAVESANSAVKRANSGADYKRSCVSFLPLKDRDWKSFEELLKLACVAAKEFRDWESGFSGALTTKNKELWDEFKKAAEAPNADWKAVEDRYSQELGDYWMDAERFRDDTCKIATAVEKVRKQLSDWVGEEEKLKEALTAAQKLVYLKKRQKLIKQLTKRRDAMSKFSADLPQNVARGDDSEKLRQNLQNALHSRSQERSWEDDEKNFCAKIQETIDSLDIESVSFRKTLRIKMEGEAWTPLNDIECDLIKKAREERENQERENQKQENQKNRNALYEYLEARFARYRIKNSDQTEVAHKIFEIVIDPKKYDLGKHRGLGAYFSKKILYHKLNKRKDARQTTGANSGRGQGKASPFEFWEKLINQSENGNRGAAKTSEESARRFDSPFAFWEDLVERLILGGLGRTVGRT